MLWTCWTSDRITRAEAVNTTLFVSWLGFVLSLAGKEAYDKYQVLALAEKRKSGEFLCPFTFLKDEGFESFMSETWIIYNVARYFSSGPLNFSPEDFWNVVKTFINGDTRL